MRTAAGGPTAVAAVRCRDDILQAMFWLRGEDPGAHPAFGQLHRLLAVDVDLLAAQLDNLVADGLVRRDGDVFSLTDDGAREGGRRFADEFGDLTKMAHGDCPPNCPHCEALRGDGCDHCVGADAGGAGWAG